MSDTNLLSPRRQSLSSFERCYAVALQRRQHGGVQFILRTGNPLQPLRTTSRPPSISSPLFRMLVLDLAAARSAPWRVSANLGLARLYHKVIFLFARGV